MATSIQKVVDWIFHRQKATSFWNNLQRTIERFNKRPIIITVMNKKLEYYLSAVEKNEGASTELIVEIQNKLDFELPHDYLELMKEFNGCEGEIGENSWLNMYSIEEIIEVNEDYKLLLGQIPDYFLFGKDSADTGYAFHKKNKTIHSFGLMSNFKKDPIEFCGNHFEEFIEYLYNQ
jgi:hypothetical protein